MSLYGDESHRRPKDGHGREPSYGYPEDLEGRYSSSSNNASTKQPSRGGPLPYPEQPGGFYGMLPGSNQALYSSYDAPQPSYQTASPTMTSSDAYRAAASFADPADDKFSFLPQKYSRKLASDDEGRHSDRDKRERRERRSSRREKKDRIDEDLAYGKPPPEVVKPKSTTADLAYGKAPPGTLPAAPAPVPIPVPAPATYGSYIPPHYAHADAEHGYDRRPPSPVAEERKSRRSRGDSLLPEPRMSGANILTVEPGDRDRARSKSRDGRRDKSPGRSSDGLKVESSRRDRSRSRDRRRDKSPGPGSDALEVKSSRRERSKSRDGRRDKSPQPPTARMSSLTVDTGGRGSNLSLAGAPASPLLESYYGTYQDCSPMPSPLLLASSQHPGEDPRALDALESLGSDTESDGRKRTRRARFHDPEDITTRLATALRGGSSSGSSSSAGPQTGPLIDILPSLTHDQVMELRVEYKRLVKTGPERKGVNVAKHIRARLKDDDPLLMKACYTVALGRWESEAYWANFWYHGDKTRRELLIESLMGRSNADVAAIKRAFADKKYDNSLTRCMKTELKEDKFKKAVLLVLDERRMDDADAHGRPLPLDYALVDRDVDDLHRAVTSDKGGESLMISIIVQRSDTHLREMLREYERHYRANFAREALRKSGNLVGELLAHILNGVINRPVRDALLLHHAITASRKDALRRELLISRLVRFHWDPLHMQAVKRAYRERYARDLQDAVRDATAGEWGLFCRELCIARMPDDVRSVERVDGRQ